MAVKDRGQLLTDNASVFGNGKNTRGDDEKEFNDDQLDSVVMKSGDTFTAGAEFEFDNGSKLREGTIDHGYGGGISRVCTNEKEDQWEDGVRYLYEISGTIVYAESMNDVIPDENYDVDFNYAIGSRFKNLVTGIEYLCTSALDEAAVWLPMSGDEVTFPSWNPSFNPIGTVCGSVAIGNEYNFFTVGNIVTVNCNFEVSIDFSLGTDATFEIDETTLPIPSTTPSWSGVGQADNSSTWPINCFLDGGSFTIKSGIGAASATYNVFFTFSYSVN
jgi:hypothetical protein